MNILGLVVSLSKNVAAATKDEERRRTHDPSATQEFLDHQHLHLVQDLRQLMNHFLRIALCATAILF